jgi:hypothetical protein
VSRRKPRVSALLGGRRNLKTMMASMSSLQLIKPPSPSGLPMLGDSRKPLKKKRKKKLNQPLSAGPSNPSITTVTANPKARMMVLAKSNGRHLLPRRKMWTRIVTKENNKLTLQVSTIKERACPLKSRSPRMRPPTTVRAGSRQPRRCPRSYP